MRDRIFFSLAALLIALLTAISAAAQTAKPWTPPFTPDGKPDLQGVWVSNAATPLERPRELAGRATLTDAEVAEMKKRADRMFKDGDSDYAAGDNAFLAALGDTDKFKNVVPTAGSSVQMIERVFDNRTSLILDPPDGRIPPLTAAGRARQDAVDAAALHPAGPEDLSTALRCITWGVPRLGGNFGSGPYSYYQIVQTPKYVVLLMEVAHEARIIPLDGRRHLPPSVRQWAGDSRGHWEGKTLVVDTTNFSSKSYYMGSAENLHLTERFTRVAPDMIEYRVTIEDPTTWSRPWTAMLPLRRSDQNIYEFACHEGNDTVSGILSGERAQERNAAEKAVK